MKNICVTDQRNRPAKKVVNIKAAGMPINLLINGAEMSRRRKFQGQIILQFL